MLPGEDVPSVGDIAHAHGVSVGTADRAFAQLREDGLIQVSRGCRGIVSPRQEEVRCRLASTLPGIRAPGIAAHSG